MDQVKLDSPSHLPLWDFYARQHYSAHAFAHPIESKFHIVATLHNPTTVRRRSASRWSKWIIDEGPPTKSRNGRDSPNCVRRARLGVHTEEASVCAFTITWNSNRKHEWMWRICEWMDILIWCSCLSLDIRGRSSTCLRVFCREEICWLWSNISQSSPWITIQGKSIFGRGLPSYSINLNHEPIN